MEDSSSLDLWLQVVLGQWGRPHKKVEVERRISPGYLPWSCSGPAASFYYRLSAPRNSFLGSDNASVPHHFRPSNGDGPCSNKSQRTTLSIPYGFPQANQSHLWKQYNLYATYVIKSGWFLSTVMHHLEIMTIMCLFEAANWYIIKIAWFLSSRKLKTCSGLCLKNRILKWTSVHLLFLFYTEALLSFPLQGGHPEWTEWMNVRSNDSPERILYQLNDL